MWTEKGFTLLELVIVVWIVGLAFFVAFPAFQGWLSGDGLGEARRHMAGLSRELRYQAVREYADQVLSLNLNEGKVAVYRKEDSPEARERAWKKAWSLPHGVTVRDLEFRGGGKIIEGEAEVLFFKDGTAVPSVFHLQEKDRNLSLVLEPFLGNLRVFERYVSYEESEVETGSGNFS